MKKTFKTTALVALLSFSTTFIAAPASAALISTEQAIAQTVTTSTDRSDIKRFFDREEVASVLQTRGVSPEMAKSRVDAMTDAEAAELAQKIDKAPAGADILGVAFTVFVILLITDILGFTRVFPFTRPIR